MPTGNGLRVHHADLGVFIEQFEVMISSLRGTCTLIVGGERPEYVTLILRHHVVTPRTLLDLYESIVINVMDGMETDENRPEWNVARIIFDQMHGRITSLISMRDTLISGAWHIEDSFLADTDLRKILLDNYSQLSNGLGVVEDLPIKAADLQVIIGKCVEAQLIIDSFLACLLSYVEGSPGGPLPFTTAFEQYDENEAGESLWRARSNNN